MRKGWSPARVLAAVVLGVWAAFFWIVWLGGRSPLFVGARTEWVVPLGAIALTIAALGRLLSARVDHVHSVARKDMLTALFLLLPVALSLSFPPSTLGSYAADRRSSFMSAGLKPSIEEILTGELTFEVIAGARSKKARAALQERAGEKVSLVGFVTRDEHSPEGGFTLNRFLITCCVADAILLRIPVVGGDAALADDDWVEVTGTLKGKEVVATDGEVLEIEQPDKPYLRA